MATVVDFGTFHTRLADATTTSDRWRLLDAFQREWGLELEDEEGIGWIEGVAGRLGVTWKETAAPRYPAG